MVDEAGGHDGIADRVRNTRVPEPAEKKEMRAKKTFGGWTQFAPATNFFYTPAAVSDKSMVVLSDAAKPGVLNKWKNVIPHTGDHADLPGKTREETRDRMSQYLGLLVPSFDHVPIKNVERDGNDVKTTFEGGAVKFAGRRYDAIHALTEFDDIYVHPDTSTGTNPAIFMKNGRPVAALAPLKQ